MLLVLFNSKTMLCNINIDEHDFVFVSFFSISTFLCSSLRQNVFFKVCFVLAAFQVLAYGNKCNNNGKIHVIIFFFSS